MDSIQSLHVGIIWVLFGHHVGIISVSCGYHVGIISVSCGYHVGIISVSCGYHVETWHVQISLTTPLNKCYDLAIVEIRS